MNLFNRVTVILGAILLIAAVVAIIALAWIAPNESIDGLGKAVKWLDDNNRDLQKVALTTFGISLAFIAVILVLLELIPSSGPEVKVSGVTVGGAVLSTAAIGQRVEEAVAKVPLIDEVKAFVKASRQGVQVALDLRVDPEANLAATSDEACEAVRNVLTDKVGVALSAPPQIRLRYRESRLKRGSPTRGQTLTSPTAADNSPTPKNPTDLQETENEAITVVTNDATNPPDRA